MLVLTESLDLQVRLNTVHSLDPHPQGRGSLACGADAQREREFFIDNLLVRVHFIIEMIWWTGLAPWEF